MKKRIVFFILLLIVSNSCYHKWELRPQIEGFVYNYDTKKPIVATVYLLPVVGEPDVDCTKTEANGKFSFDKITADDWALPGGEAYKPLPSSNKIVITSFGFINDTIDYTEKEWVNNSIKIGVVYLKIKSINK